MDVGIIRPQIWEGVQSQGLQSLLGGDKGYTLGANVNYEDSFINIDANQACTPAIAVSTAPVSAGASPTVFGYIQHPVVNGLAPLNPPYVMYSDSDNSTAAARMRVFPVSVRGMRFVANITDGSFNIGQANSAPTLANANVVVGKQLPLIVGGTTTPAPAGRYAGVFAVNVASTTNPMIRIVEIPLRFKSYNQRPLASTYNGIVVFEFLDSVIVSL